MTFAHALSVIPVTDLTVSTDWYERLVGMPPTNVPMPGILAEWRVTSTGWLQVSVDEERAGSTEVNLAVTDLETAVREIGSRGISVGEIQHVNKGVELAPISDPDGNVVTLIGNFREKY
jgi:glyoxylase I family protein